MSKKQVLIIVIALCLLAGIAACRKNMDAKENTEELGAYTNQPEWEDTVEPDSVSISRDDLIDKLNESGTLWEFAQSLFTDIILYKDAVGQYTYTPVDKRLPLSDYDWSKLERLLKNSKELEYRVDGKAVSIKGIDVSAYQEKIDWEKVAADGVRFAFIRLGYRGYNSGKITLDERFKENIEGALRNGIQVGIYFVSQAINTDEALEEAQFVVDSIAPYNVTWPVVLDIESTGGADPRTADVTAGERTDYTIAFCDKIAEAGYRPMLYSNIGWYLNELELERLTGYDKWFAQYFNHPFFPYAFQIWQYTSSGSVDGIKGNVDLNISMYDYGAGEYVPYRQ